MKLLVALTVAFALAEAVVLVSAEKGRTESSEGSQSHEELYEQYGYEPQNHHGHYSHGYPEDEANQIITHRLPVPYSHDEQNHVPVEVKVPYPVQVEKEVPVYVEKKIPVYVEKEVPVHVDRPYPVEVKVPVHIPVYKKEYIHVPKPYAVHVDKPVPVYVKQPVYVDKYVPVTVHIKEQQKKKPFWHWF